MCYDIHSVVTTPEGIEVGGFPFRFRKGYIEEYIPRCATPIPQDA